MNIVLPCFLILIQKKIDDCYIKSIYFGHYSNFTRGNSQYKCLSLNLNQAGKISNYYIIHRNTYALYLFIYLYIYIYLYINICIYLYNLNV